jgi:nuclear transport factor 2 (NTF2) superfamily protein
VTLPADPAAFVAAAERGINDRDLDVTAGLYAPDAVLTSITDGALERIEGAEAIRRSWAAYLDGMRARQFWLRKTLSAASGDTIANEWVGGFGVGGPGLGANGSERWRFDEQGRVVDHVMWTFFDVRESTSLMARARIGLASPRTAIAFLRAQKRHGA